MIRIPLFETNNLREINFHINTWLGGDSTVGHLGAGGDCTVDPKLLKMPLVRLMHRKSMSN